MKANIDLPSPKQCFMQGSGRWAVRGGPLWAKTRGELPLDQRVEGGFGDPEGPDERFALLLP